MQQTPVLQPALHRFGPCLPAIRLDRLRTAKALVEKAVKTHRIFSILGRYPVIRAALRSRGWVEKRLSGRLHRSSAHSQGGECEDGEEGDASPESAEAAEEEEIHDDMSEIMSRMVRNELTYFFWSTRRDAVECHALRKEQMVNHYEKAAAFTTKVGLCVSLRSLQWFDSADPDTFFPRSYVLGAEDDKHAFIEDFRRTACTSLLQHVVESQNSEPSRTLLSDSCSSVSSGIIETALGVCQDFLIDLDHGNIDRAAESETETETKTREEQQWEHFLHQYHLVVHDGAEIRDSGLFVEQSVQMLRRLRRVCPQLHTDGVNNIWIIKPGAKSRGRGIICLNRLDDILVLVEQERAVLRDSRWVVQKYLERPLLVHGCKFDMRQWFLVTDWNPLTVWFYGECYLRFSTQPYSTKNLHSSVHLCNNSIQKHFQPSPDRHPELPEDNMWSCGQFRSFLRGQDREEQWEAVVVPGMKQALVRSLQTAQDSVVQRKNSFELYGADFMLGQDLRPWLLEINSSPTMSCSTEVTARLCPAVQADTLRVVLDRRNNPHAHTGGFTLIYKQAAVERPQYVGVNLLIEGAPIRRHRPQLKPPASAQSPDAPVSASAQSPDAPVSASAQSPDAPDSASAQSPDAPDSASAQSPDAPDSASAQSPDAPDSASVLSPPTSASATSPDAPASAQSPPAQASAPSCPRESQITHKPAVLKAHTLAIMIQYNKENQSEKRRKKLSRSGGPERRAAAKLAHHRCMVPPELPLIAHAEPQRKARRVGYSLSTAPLVPRSLSFSCGPPNTSTAAAAAAVAPQTRGAHVNPGLRFSLPHTQPQRAALVLPSIRVISLRAQSHRCRSSALTKQLFLLPFEQSK